MGRQVIAFEITVNPSSSISKEIFESRKSAGSVVKRIVMDFPDANNLNISVSFKIGTIPAIPITGEFKSYGGKIEITPEFHIPQGASLSIVVSNQDATNIYTIVGFLEVEP